MKFKNLFQRIFIDGLGGMGLGLFATLIIGTIIQQVGTLIGGTVGSTLFLLGKIAAAMTGAGIGVGVAYKFKESPLVVVSAATAGMVGAFAGNIAKGTVFVDGVIHFAGPGEPLGAFIAAYVGIELGHLISGKTSVDILLTPFVSIVGGSAVGLFAGPPISAFMTWLGSLINWGTEQRPFLMGIIVSVLMGIILTLPISSAALGIVLNLSGIAAGAATVGCCANMIGFAVASYRENKVGGLLAQGLGTSMLQIPNIMRKPIIWRRHCSERCSWPRFYRRPRDDQQCDRLRHGYGRPRRTDHDLSDNDSFPFPCCRSAGDGGDVLHSSRDHRAGCLRVDAQKGWIKAGDLKLEL